MHFGHLVRNFEFGLLARAAVDDYGDAHRLVYERKG